MRYGFVATGVVFFCLTAAAPARAAVPMDLVGPGCDDDDGDGFLDDPADCPDDLVGCLGASTQLDCLSNRSCSWNADTNHCEGIPWDYASFMPARWRPQLRESQEIAMGSGASLDRAWQRTVGSFETVIAVMDSGIKWDEGELRRKYYLNRGELPVPNGADDLPTAGRVLGDNPACPSDDPWDHNQDCVFNVDDYADDARVSPTASTPYVGSDLMLDCNPNHPFAVNGASIAPHFNDFLEPSDLLCVFSDGVDDDNNGYLDDISGWDFLWDDNNAYDDTRYGHGTGEGRDSTGEGDNGGGTPGSCPNCALLEIRAGDSFVVDVNAWAAGVVFAVDSGADVLQSAVGAINNSSYAQAVTEYAYARGVINIVSAADETAQHQNYPGALPHGEYVHAIRYDKDDIGQATTFLNFSNCTNFGGRLVLSASSTSCSSGATGISSGVAGLVSTAARMSGVTLTGNENHQIFVKAYDEIDLPTSQPSHAEHNGKAYPSGPGWDLWFGYGRLNARKAVDMVLDNEIPPEADILSPDWWQILDPTKGSVQIRGTVRAQRSALASWYIEYSPSVEPRPDDSWFVLNSGASPIVDGVLADFDLSLVPLDALSRIEPYNTRPERGAVDDNVTKAFKANRYAITLRLRVIDADGREGEDRRVMYVHHDSTWKAGFPLKIGRSGESSPKMYDLDGDGAMEVIFGDADGYVHAITSDATELPGFPTRTNAGRAQRHSGSRAFTHGPDDIAGNGDELEDDIASTILATPGIGDLDNDGVIDVVVATLDGELYAFAADGSLKTGFPVPVPGDTRGADTTPDEFYEIGIFAAPVLADLDGDEDLEIIVAALDHQVFAVHHDGAMVAGFPVRGPQDPNDPNKAFLRLTDPADPIDPDGQGRRIVSSPAVGDLDGDGNLEVVVGTNEAINDALSRVYAFTYDKALGQPRPYGKVCGQASANDNCFPIQMVGGYPNALPYVGEGTPGSPVLADLDNDGTLEIGAASIADFGRLYRHDGFNAINTQGSSFKELKSGGGYYGLNSNSKESSTFAMINSGSFGDLDGDGVLDYALGAAGASFVNNLVNDGERTDFDHQVAVWSTGSGEMLPGYPQIMEDLQFFLNPLIADVDGDGDADLVNTSATFVVHAWDAQGNRAKDFPKFTGQWQIASPALGDMDGDGALEMAVITRAGWLFVYELDGKAKGDGANVQWSSFRHDARNTGSFGTEDPTLVIPPKLVAPPVEEGCGCRSGQGSPVLLALLGGVFLFVRRRRRS